MKFSCIDHMTIRITPGDIHGDGLQMGAEISLDFEESHFLQVCGMWGDPRGTGLGGTSTLCTQEMS